MKTSLSAGKTREAAAPEKVGIGGGASGPSIQPKTFAERLTAKQAAAAHAMLVAGERSWCLHGTPLTW